MQLFDVFTPFSVGLVYLMHRSFQQVSLHKPNTSRPANSERYLVCKWKRHDAGDIEDYLLVVNNRLNQLGLDLLGSTRSTVDVVQLVPPDVMEDEFRQYIVDNNNLMGERQIIGLAKIAAFCKNDQLTEPRYSPARPRFSSEKTHLRLNIG